MDRGRFIPHPFRRFSMDRAVAVVCGELMQISLAFSAYYPLCSGGPPCAYAEAVERLIRRAASARDAEELVEVMEGRVRLEEVGLPAPALEVLAEELGPEPRWLDALAASFFRLYLGLHRRRRVDGRDLAFALCLWAQKKRREDPRNPLWRAAELEPDRLYTEEEAREALNIEEALFRRLWRRALAFHRGEKAYGFQLILAAISLLAAPPRSV
jgi:HEPN domain-containing protein